MDWKARNGVKHSLRFDTHMDKIIIQHFVSDEAQTFVSFPKTKVPSFIHHLNSAAKQAVDLPTEEPTDD